MTETSQISMDEVAMELPETVNDQITDSVTQEHSTMNTDEPETFNDSFNDSFDETAGMAADDGRSELEKLIARRTGFFNVKMSEEDIKWVKNACNDKFKFEGPQEAFMVMNCYLGFSSALAKIANFRNEGAEAPSIIPIQAAAVEAAAMMVSRYEGVGVTTAERLFRIAIALNGPAMEMKDLDDKINELKRRESQG